MTLTWYRHTKVHEENSKLYWNIVNERQEKSLKRKWQLCCTIINFSMPVPSQRFSDIVAAKINIFDSSAAASSTVV
jgi:hypothetical protein